MLSKDIGHVEDSRFFLGNVHARDDSAATIKNGQLNINLRMIILTIEYQYSHPLYDMR